MKRSSLVVVVALAGAALMSLAATASAAWRGVTDAQGCTWARVRIVNDSSTDSNWSLSNCRTAVESTETTATVDADSDWSGLVPAGTETVVWVYGQDLVQVNVANADGGTSSYFNQASILEGGDGELVILVGNDGSPLVSIEPTDAYTVPFIHP
jgi:hypothetical protein